AIIMVFAAYPGLSMADDDGAVDVTVWDDDGDFGDWSDPMDNITEESGEYGGTGSGREPDADVIEAGGGDGTGRFD
ncbi:hypothetical protein ACFL4E_03915, partial [Candidatus Omnitrophota bacterium]